jgi:copper chaperone NosL
MAICGMSLVAVLYTPIWRIDLDAPQYPEGLRMKIHANDIRGNVDIINGLNHYIGMKTLHKEDFLEFTVLPYCIGFFVALFLLVAIINRKKWFYTSFFLFVAFGILAMVDFWKWEYNYGHNLDPHAAIVVPGMAYQPPLIGFKQLLNFGAYSIPDIGGWIFIGCGAILLLCVAIEWMRKRKFKKANLTIPALLFLLSSMSSCTTAPEVIKIGKDNCAFCKMTISDPRFGSEIVTKTGKVFKFDDIKCMEQFLKAADDKGKQNAGIYLVDFCGNHGLIETKKSILLKSIALKCPMNGGIAAFSNIDSFNVVKETYQGEKVSWGQL